MYFKNEPDENLVMLTLAGEQTAYEELVTRYQKAVISSALYVTKTRFMAEDAAQDAFVTAWMKLDTLQEPGKFGSWVCRIARNCALNMINRYRGFLPLDVVDAAGVSDGGAHDPARLYESSREKEEVNESINALPEKVRQIIRLHYFEDLSVAEIADRLRIPEGTVKWQLHEGRKKIRKELCAMNEKYGDTLVERVMKKVEELKLWQLKNDKSGFEKAYDRVLREVEELPECREKHHALADVLMRGWWWLPGNCWWTPGKKNDEIFERISSAAEAGKNEDVMAFIASREDSRLSGVPKIEFIRDKQIPRLEKAGFVKALGREWFWLGYNLFSEGMAEEGRKAFDRAEEILAPDDLFRVLIPYARKMEDLLVSRYKNTSVGRLLVERYLVGCSAFEYRVIDGALRFWGDEGVYEGSLFSVDRRSEFIFRNAFACDGRFSADISAGETLTGSDGTLLTHISDGETVETPAGTFDNCAVWEARLSPKKERTVFRTWFKDGVGIVRQDVVTDGVRSTELLSDYEIKGGSGPLPLYEGNSWSYSSGYKPEFVSSKLDIKVEYFDGERAVVSSDSSIERHAYDEDSWEDMVQKISQEYWTYNGRQEIIRDVSPAIERAEQLAVTPLQKAHTKAAASAARRIIETDSTVNPDRTAAGVWNFFTRQLVCRGEGVVRLTEYNPRWSFEWKGSTGKASEDQVLFNDILGILNDAADAVWSDEWRIGASPIVEYSRYGYDVRTQITCEDGGVVTTKAGTFENCLKINLDISGMTGGVEYRGGVKTYWLAEGIGVVRTEGEYDGGTKKAVYELTSYEGVGEGYMPFSDGFTRRYDATGTTDGYIGAAEYYYVADDEGDVVVFSDRTGIRELPKPVTSYSEVLGEVIEENLWNAGKRVECRQRFDINNFNLICHFLTRRSNLGYTEKTARLRKYLISLIEGLKDGENVPEAWLGYYARLNLSGAAAFFGCGKKDEGYAMLDKAFETFPLWDAIPDGTEMNVGNPWILGDIKVVKGKSVIKLPDGTTEPIPDEYMTVFEETGDLPYIGMTSPGWVWFDSVRTEDKFKEYVERAKKMVKQR